MRSCMGRGRGIGEVYSIVKNSRWDFFVNTKCDKKKNGY